jgi:DNA repair exonuclease SbcCD ATPase subunit
MRILNLQAENVKRLRVVEITPDGDVVIISGKNGAGKTSVLDAIWLALAGGKASRASDTTKPVREGADAAHVRLDLGELVVTRSWNAKTGTTALKVEAKDGARYGKPQEVLDRFLGQLSFDPLAFAGQDERTQLTTLMGLVELPFDPSLLASQRLTAYENRTDANRELKRFEAQLSGMPEVDAPDEEILTTKVLDDLAAAEALGRANDEIMAAWAAAGTKADQARINLTDCERELEARKEALAQSEAEVERLATEVEALPDVPATESFREQLAGAEETNRLVRAKRERVAVVNKASLYRESVEELTAEIQGIDDAKEAGIREAKMPIDGLGFTEEGVTYNGIPFKQASAAEQLRVSVAMAMAMNPELRVIRITDGSLLDSDNMALIAGLAAEHDFQVWIERVDETGQVGVVIEDGQVAE